MPRRKGDSTVKTIDYAAVNDILVPYRRVSTREQAERGAGLPAQKTAITHALSYRGQQALTWDCVDEGKSGKNLQRAGLDTALGHVRAGTAGGIIVSKLDRLSRSLLDFAYLMMLADKEGWNLVALDLGVDLQTPQGKLMAGILALFAEFERNVIRQRTKDGLAEKRAAGVRLGRPRSISDELLQWIIETYEIEGSYGRVAMLLNEAEAPTPQGGKMWYSATIQKILRSQDGLSFIRRLEEAS